MLGEAHIVLYQHQGSSAEREQQHHKSAHIRLQTGPGMKPGTPEGVLMPLELTGPSPGRAVLLH